MPFVPQKVFFEAGTLDYPIAQKILERKYKYGQFGYGKYLYQLEQIEAITSYFREAIEDFFPGASIDYTI